VQGMLRPRSDSPDTDASKSRLIEAVKSILSLFLPGGFALGNQSKSLHNISTQLMSDLELRQRYPRRFPGN
jgi:hypothetical protein